MTTMTVLVCLHMYIDKHTYPLLSVLRLEERPSLPELLDKDRELLLKAVEFVSVMEPLNSGSSK